MNEKVEQKLREKIRTTIKDKLSEAISGADRKILFILIREIVRNLKPKIKNMDVDNKSHIDRVGSSILGIIRAMTYTPDNANYKNFKKYFPKNFNNKLVQKKLKQFHSQNDKVQVTLVTQAIKNELSEGKVTEAIKKVSDAEDGAGFRQDWIGIYKGKFIQFKANFPVDAKKHTINYFKVPKSKYSEVVVISKKEYDVQQKLKVEGKLTEKAGEHGMAFAQWVVVKDSKGKMFNYNPKKKEIEPFGGGKKMKLSQIKDKKFLQSLKKIKLEGKLTEKVKYKKDKKIGGKWYTKQGTHKHQMKANIIAKREFGRYYDAKVVKEKGGYTIYVRPLKEGKLTENKIYSKKDGLKIVKKLQAKDKKIYKVDKQKATYDGKKVLMYNLYTKDKSKYSGNNLHGLDMARNSKGEAMYLVPIQEGGREIAKTILQQLGGNKFIAMTGAKNLGFTDKGLQMQIGRNSKGVTHVIIELDRGKDLYNIEFVQVRKFKRKTIKKLKGIYADQLGEIFTRYTGLRIRL